MIYVTEHKKHALNGLTHRYASWYGLNRVLACTVLSDTRRWIRKHEITPTEMILLYISMHILKLSIGSAVLQQRHMPYIAVSAGLIHTTQFHLPRTVATVLNQGLGYGFNLKMRVFFMKIMNSLCPPSKKMVHIALCMSVGWSVYLDSLFPTTCETYNTDCLTP